MFKRCLILGFFVFLSACAGSKTTVIETNQKVETITEITEKKLDTTLVIPEEKVSISIPFKKFTSEPIKLPEPKIFTQRSGRSSVTVKIDSTGIKATSNCDSIAERLDYYEKTFKEFRKETTDTQKKVSEKKGYSKFQLILYMIVAAVVCLTAGYLTKTFKLL
jgi:hypothetical protein